MTTKSTYAAIALSLGLGAVSNAAIVATTSVTSTTVPSNGTSIAALSDRVLSTSTATFPTPTTLTEANKLTLVSNNAYSFDGGGGGQYLADNNNGLTYTFNFAGGATIGQILLWNYSQNSVRGLDAVSMVEVDTGSGFIDQSLSLTLLDAGTANFRAQALNLSGALAGVTSIRLTVAQAGTGGGETAGGFDEVAFSSVPEPSAATLLGLGGLALILRRRK